LSLLNAFNAGKSSGKEVMILQLEQIVLNYGKTPEGEKAKEMLNYLKSDVAFQATDNKGNTVSQVSNNQPQNPSGYGQPGQNLNIPQSQNITAPGNQNNPLPNSGQPMNNAIQSGIPKKPLANPNTQQLQPANTIPVPVNK